MNDNPVIYNATAPTLAPGGQTQMQADANGNLKVSVQSNAPPAATTLSEVVINTTSSSTIALVGATSSQTTKLYRMLINTGGATTLEIKDGATSLTGPMQFFAGGGLVLDYSPVPWFTGSANTTFNLIVGSSVQVSGRAYYIKS